MSVENQYHQGQFLGTLSEGDRVTEHYRVVRKSVKTSRAGEPYLDIDLADKTGVITARLFKPRHTAGDPVATFASLFKVGDTIRVSGRVDLFQGKLQLIMDKLRISLPEEVDDALFEKASRRPLAEMEEELGSGIGAIGDPALRALAEKVFSDRAFYTRFITAPAATRLHHAYRRGLLEHTISLLRAAELLLPHYPELHADLVRIGVLFHDLGKTEELGERAGEAYTIEGTLEGHIFLGARRIDRAIDSIEGFPDELRRLVLHMILSHHGELEFGSPVLPACAEAVFLSGLDNLDAKLANVRETLESDRNNESPFTDLFASGAIRRKYYKGVPKSGE